MFKSSSPLSKLHLLIACVFFEVSMAQQPAAPPPSTPSPSKPPSAPDDDDDDGLQAWAIALIVVGSVIGFLLLMYLWAHTLFYPLSGLCGAKFAKRISFVFTFGGMYIEALSPMNEKSRWATDPKMAAAAGTAIGAEADESMPSLNMLPMIPTHLKVSTTEL